jgi:hypothetical protein
LTEKLIARGFLAGGAQWNDQSQRDQNGRASAAELRLPETEWSLLHGTLSWYELLGF